MKHVFTLIFWFLVWNASAQSVVSGKILDAQGRPVENVNLILYQHHTDEIIAYTLSDQKGNYQISYSSSQDTLRLEATCMGFEKSFVLFKSSGSKNFNFTLKTSSNQLKDIEIKQEAIRMNGDTINYDAKSFSDKHDRVLIDVIKKLPGISVTESGQILFNNKAINKFYVEGKDLLEDRYNIATNNLPSDAVKQIQVLQHHQPIRLLNGMVSSDRAAINIRLNENAKFRLLGNGHVGTGFSPLLSDQNLTLLKFSKKLQFINTLKQNNIGLDLGQELNEQNMSPNFIQAGGVRQDVLSLIKAATPPVDQSRYRFNHNTMASGNYLTGLGPGLELKLNAAYERDRLKDFARSVTTLLLPKDTLIIIENHEGVSVGTKLIGNATLQANNKKLFLKNALKFSKEWNLTADSISPLQIQQELLSPFVHVMNELNAVLNVKDHLIGFSSFSSYADQSQELTIRPGQHLSVLNGGEPYQGNFQQIRTKQYFTDHAASVTEKSGAFSFTEKLGFLTHMQVLYNDLEIDRNNQRLNLPGQFRQLIKRNRFSLYNDADLNWSLRQLSCTFLLKANMLSLSNLDSIGQQSEHRILLNPSLNLNYKFGFNWDAGFGISYAKNLGYESNPSFILLNYRTLSNNNIPLREVRSRNLSVNVGYKDVINALYSNLTLQVSKSISNILINNEFDGILNTRTTQVQDNPYQYLDLNWNINKYDLALKTSFDLSLMYSRLRMKQVQQDQLADFFSHTGNLGVKTNTRINNWLNVQYQVDFLINKNLVRLTTQKLAYPGIRALNQRAKLNFVLPKDVQMNLGLAHDYNHNGPENHSDYLFADLGVTKSLTKPKIDFSVSASNLFNQKVYQTYAYNNNMLLYSNYQLRGRMLMFRISFQF